jgi:hypothetical protein
MSDMNDGLPEFELLSEKQYRWPFATTTTGLRTHRGVWDPQTRLYEGVDNVNDDPKPENTRIRGLMDASKQLQKKNKMKEAFERLAEAILVPLSKFHVRNNADDDNHLDLGWSVILFSLVGFVEWFMVLVSVVFIVTWSVIFAFAIRNGARDEWWS